jgi:hypothetical protein
MPILSPFNFPPPVPLQAEADPAVTERNVAHFQDEGRSLLLSVARPLRLADAFRQRRLAPEQGRRLLHGIVAAVRPVVLSVTDALIAGSLRLAGWFRSMRDALVPGYFAGALAVLDDPDPPPADVAAIVAEANRQVGYLGRFRDEIATAVHILGPGTLARGVMYAEALWSTSLKVQRAEKIRDGLASEMNRLGSADHCPDCIAQTLRKWVPIGTLIEPGSRQCLTRCRCWLEYR